MKKIVCLALIVTMVFSLCACSPIDKVVDKTLEKKTDFLRQEDFEAHDSAKEEIALPDDVYAEGNAQNDVKKEEENMEKEERPIIHLPQPKETAIEGSQFVLKVAVSNIYPTIKEKISVIVTLQNVSGDDIIVEIADWFAADQKIEILEAAFMPIECEYFHRLIGVQPKPQITIAKDAIIEKTYEFSMECFGEFKIIAGAYFYIIEGNIANSVFLTSMISEMKIFVGGKYDA